MQHLPRVCHGSGGHTVWPSLLLDLHPEVDPSAIPLPSPRRSSAQHRGLHLPHLQGGRHCTECHPGLLRATLRRPKNRGSHVANTATRSWCPSQHACVAGRPGESAGALPPMNLAELRLNFYQRPVSLSLRSFLRFCFSLPSCFSNRSCLRNDCNAMWKRMRHVFVASVHMALFA